MLEETPSGVSDQFVDSSTRPTPTRSPAKPVSAASLAKRIPEVAPLGKQIVCVVAFSDDFKPGDVTHAKVQRAGRYAVVVVDSHQRVVVSFVLDRLPLRFRHPV